MAIDVKEWSKRLYDDAPWPEQRQFIEGVVDLIRAVIADEAAKQKRDHLHGLLGRQPEPTEHRADDAQTATGDVPEWFDFTWFTTDDAVFACLAAVEAEIARRVEAANRCHILSKGDDCVCTLCVQTRHIAKLQQQLADAQAEIERLQKELTASVKYHARFCKKIDRALCEPRYDDDMLATFIRRIDELNAEVERLNAANTVLEADVRQLSASAKEARAEVERLSRPVENETVIHHLPESRRYVPIANFVAERNAREAADARERKLREFVRMRVTFRWPDNSLSIGRREPPLTDAELDRLLAAFDADGKVQA